MTATRPFAPESHDRRPGPAAAHLAARPIVHQPVQPPLLSVDFVAARLGVSKMTVYRLIHRGDLNAHQIGKSYRVEPSDLRDYLRGVQTSPWDDER